MNKKRKSIMVGVIAFVLFIGISVALICIVKYREEHRYLSYSELPQSQILFIKTLTEEYENDFRTRLQAIDAGGRIYTCTLYGESFELNDSTYAEIMDCYVEENNIEFSKVQEMYGLLLEVDRKAEFEIVSDTFVLDSGTTGYYGVRFQENDEVEYVLLWSKGENFGQGIINDSYTKDICKWLSSL